MERNNKERIKELQAEIKRLKTLDIIKKENRWIKGEEFFIPLWMTGKERKEKVATIEEVFIKEVTEFYGVTQSEVLVSMITENGWYAQHMGPVFCTKYYVNWKLKHKEKIHGEFLIIIPV